MRGKTMVETAEIGKAYDETSPVVSAVGDGQFHLWYWHSDEDGAALAEAMRRITRKVAGALALEPGERVLDAGCGCGGPAVQLASDTGADVTGVTVSRVQVAQARARGAQSEAAGRVRFEYGDYTELDYADASFDAVVALESLQCAPDLPAATAELARVLRPGGRIAITEFSRERAMTDADAARFAASIGINTLHTLDGWLDALTRAGFDIEEYTQCGPRVFGRRKWKYLDHVDALRGDLTATFGAAAVAEFEDGVRPFFAPAAEHLGYVVIVAGKPHDSGPAGDGGRAGDGG
ncbi:SAM-dependent methyltransferase [Streptomyces boncukensis]|uniref:Methyltransferase domain-containing protein n=1 Tax=Streptomyces boncukensis TaxID=2711219 RepID=A0A6G4WPE2_9ACTN|nr:methyltransferase domain-containing protein [Streptomyces boncukensis]NGO66883.1 methyltransferase domain-containing protein [Streptomyces boncukensis]